MFENHVALHVTDETQYQNYRNAMLPILESYGGGFRYDFKISEVLKSETDNKINRVFIIYVCGLDIQNLNTIVLGYFQNETIT